jgi:hypothetical protein
MEQVSNTFRFFGTDCNLLITVRINVSTTKMFEI